MLLLNAPSPHKEPPLKIPNRHTPSRTLTCNFGCGCMGIHVRVCLCVRQCSGGIGLIAHSLCVAAISVMLLKQCRPKCVIPISPSFSHSLFSVCAHPRINRRGNRPEEESKQNERDIYHLFSRRSPRDRAVTLFSLFSSIGARS